ncbi:MAG: DHHA1 domain-containing protein [Candidatus Promineifilaceae bacterium]|nr:DHHA1 domain-containing protein [Candidatus Promineifilaceae bacterium]
MTTERAYHFDAYTIQFRAQIIDKGSVNGQPMVVLDRTYFYPTSGGQPHDLGRINGSQVVDVFIRPQDKAIVHVLQEPLQGQTAVGEIQWQRRFDHMQQHTGQHILSQAFIETLNAETIGFHLGQAASTIDLNVADLDEKQQRRAEELANRVIWENRPIHIRLVDRAELGTVSLRKIPGLDEDELRLVEISDFDLTACGGTHVAATGEIGQIKLTGVERRGSNVRVAFLCGMRALADYQIKNNVVAALGAELTTGITELVSSVVGLQDELKHVRQQHRRLLNQLAKLEAERMLNQASTQDASGATVIVQVYEEQDRKRPAIRALANALTSHDEVTALLAMAGPSAYLVFARSDNAAGDMNRLLQRAFNTLGSGRGGGSQSFAQGGGTAATKSQLERALTQAASELASSDGSVS